MFTQALQTVTALPLQVNELTMQNEYQLRLKDLALNERVKELTEKFAAEADVDKTKFDILLQEKNEQEMEYEEKLKHAEERHQVSMSTCKGSHVRGRCKFPGVGGWEKIVDCPLAGCWRGPVLRHAENEVPRRLELSATAGWPQLTGPTSRGRLAGPQRPQLAEGACCLCCSAEARKATVRHQASWAG